MKAEITSQHEWLQRLVGSWQMDCGDSTEAGMGGRETVRLLGSNWIIGEGTMDMGEDGPGHSVLTLGYNPASGKFVGAWVGSMMNHLWVYEGDLSEDGKTLTLNCDGPRFDGQPGLVKYQDIYTIVDENTRVLRSQVLTDEGQWHQFMEATYRRV